MNSLIFAVFNGSLYISNVPRLAATQDFNKTYTMLRKLVAQRLAGVGRIKSGTIVMFAVDENGQVLKASKMQRSQSRVSNMDDYVGEDIHYFDKYNPLVRKENIS